MPDFGTAPLLVANEFRMGIGTVLPGLPNALAELNRKMTPPPNTPPSAAVPYRFLSVSSVSGELGLAMGTLVELAMSLRMTMVETQFVSNCVSLKIAPGILLDPPPMLTP